MSNVASAIATRLHYLRFSRRFRRSTLWVTGAVVFAGVAWIIVTGLLVRRETKAIQDKLSQVQTAISAGDVAQARTDAADLPSMVEHADELTSGPAWWVAAHVPYLGRPAEVARGVTSALSDFGSTAIPTLLSASTALDPNTIRVNGHTIAIDRLTRAAPLLVKASHDIQEVESQLTQLSSSTWLGRVDSEKSQLGQRLSRLGDYVDATARAAKILPTMLGSDGPKTYFVGLQNEAELRGTGGLSGAFAIATADHGTVRFTRFESDTVLLPPKTGQLVKTGLDFGAEYNAAWAASNPLNSFVDSNVSPHFPYAAQIWATMWEKVSGQHVDGSIALDPTALSYFLGATGSVTLESGQVIDAKNIVPLVERDEYTLFKDNNKRKAFLVSILKASTARLLSGQGLPAALFQAISKSSQEQRLLVWTRDATAQKFLSETNYAGEIPQNNRPFSGVILNNAAAGKLDYYLSRDLNYSRSGCGPFRDVVATITLRNNAPASGLSRYVTDRLDQSPPKNVKPGDNRTLLDYWATDGADLLSVTVNGAPVTASSMTALGHQVFRMDLELPRAASKKIVIHLREPTGSGSPIIWRQPGVSPLQVETSSQSCR